MFREPGAAAALVALRLGGWRQHSFQSHVARSEQIVRSQIVASTYNEPLITTEWAVSIFKRAQAAGMKTVYISNGNGTPEVLDYLAPHLDGYKIDLKSMRDKPSKQPKSNC